MDNDVDTRLMCKYGVDCYQRNPEHHKKYKHPKRKSDEQHEEVKRNKLSSPPPNVSPKKMTVPSNSNSENSTEDTSMNKVQLTEDISSRIEEVYLVKMPEDFYSFYSFCESLDKKNPHNALVCVDINLVGPFDLINRNVKKFTPEEGLRHYRYYYDPPEFQTVLACNNKQLLHYGYFRDEPKDMPCFVGSNEANSGCTIEIVGSNIFSALHYHIEKVKKLLDPFKKMKLQKIQQALTNWCTKNKFDLDTRAKTCRERKAKMVTKSFHGAGIVVPFDRKTELGYRELKESDEELKKILHNLCKAKSEVERQVFWTKLQPVITYANIANDECDFGTTLELGIDLFCFGDPLLHKSVLSILTTSYELLGRNEFATVLRAHLEYRNKGSDLNTII